MAALALLASLDHATRSSDDDRPLVTHAGTARHAPVVLPVARASRRGGAPAFKYALFAVPALLGPAARYATISLRAPQLVVATHSRRHGARAPPIG